MKTLSFLAGLVGISLLCTGCDIKPEQIKVISQNAGLFSAVGWIAVDNPDSNAVESVKIILVTIEEKSADVQAGATYTEVVYPEVVKVIDEKVEVQYRPVCKAGALSLLGGIDILFATHPEWKADQDLAIEVVNAFILGAKAGLSMKEGDPVMIQARVTATKRAKVLVPAPAKKNGWFRK